MPASLANVDTELDVEQILVVNIAAVGGLVAIGLGIIGVRTVWACSALLRVLPIWASFSQRLCLEPLQRPLLLAGLAPGRPCPCNGFADLLPRRVSRLPRGTKKLGYHRPPLRCGPRVQVGRTRRLKTAIEAASGGFEQQSGVTTMAQIGTFTRSEDGSFNGTIRTLNINTKATIRPVTKDGERSPDYRVTANGVELGAGWSKAAKDTGAEYISVKLDDPSFTGPVYATLVQGEADEHKLIWSR